MAVLPRLQRIANHLPPPTRRAKRFEACATVCERIVGITLSIQPQCWPLHGDASGRVEALFSDVMRLGEDKVMDHHLSTGLPLAGFGHHLYPDGDPRAVVTAG